MFCSQRPETRYANLQMPPSHYHDYDGTFTILLFSSTVTASSFCLPHFNKQLQPTDPFSVASLKDIPLWAITKEPNSSGLCRQLAVQGYTNTKFAPFTRLRLLHPTSQQSKLNAWSHTDINKLTGIIVVYVLYIHKDILQLPYYVHCCIHPDQYFGWSEEL